MRRHWLARAIAFLSMIGLLSSVANCQTVDYEQASATAAYMRQILGTSPSPTIATVSYTEPVSSNSNVAAVQPAYGIIPAENQNIGIVTVGESTNQEPSTINATGFEPAWTNGSIGCTDGGCIGCNQGGTCAGSCGAWAHYSTVYGEFLYLRARNSDIAYGVPVDGPITSPPSNNPIQVGPVGIVDPDHEGGYATGIRLALSPLSSLDIKYSSIDFLAENSIATEVPNVIRSLVSHPSSLSVATDFLSASASLEIEYDTLDLTFRHLFVGGDVYAVNYFLGARYGRLDQMFESTFVDNEIEDVRSDVDFEGVGLRIGLEAERHSCRTRIRYYARGAANLLAGRFRANYVQGTNFDPVVVDTDWEAGRVVPTLDLEVGVGWNSRYDRVRISAGYRYDSWFNMVTNEDFIWAVQQNNFLGLEDTMSFDGLVGRVELRF